MKRIYVALLLLIILCALNLPSFGQSGASNQTKKVAILEPVDKQGNVEYYLKSMLRGKLTKAVTSTLGYEAYDRADIDNVLKEQDFQRTGLVGDNVVEMGKFKGVSYILISEIVKAGNEQVYITAKILNVQTTKVDEIEDQRAGITPEQMEKGCLELVGKLFGGRSGGTSQSNTPSYSNYNTSAGSNYTETAFGINMKMVWVEGGSFIMGCTGEQGSDCFDDEKNTRRVNLTGYYIGMTEVTQGQWQKVMGTSIEQQRNKVNPNYTFAGIGADYPMYYVSWEEAMAFCEELSQQTGKRYTLPTEAQWEYAARGGNKNDGTKYSGSYSIDAVAWYSGNSGNRTHIVGSKRPNGLGLYDMSGNVWEWCKDWYANSYIGYQTDNPTGPSGGSARVRRGGSWSGDARYCRVSYRSIDFPGRRRDVLGFRVVCVP